MSSSDSGRLRSETHVTIPCPRCGQPHAYCDPADPCRTEDLSQRFEVHMTLNVWADDLDAADEIVSGIEFAAGAERVRIAGWTTTAAKKDE